MNTMKCFLQFARMALCMTAGLAAGALSGCGGGGNAAPVVEPPPPVTTPAVAVVKPGVWVVMGSSSAAGAGAPAGKGWADLVQEAFRIQGAQLANIARGGTSTYHGMSAATVAPPGRPAPDSANNVDQALSRNPAVLLVSYPTNDTALGYSVSETVNNLLAIRAVARARSVPVIVLSTQPRNLSSNQLSQLKAIDDQISAIVGPCFVALNAALAGADGKLAPANDAGDGVHPSEAGHRIIAERVKALVDEAKCIKVTS